MQIRVTRDHDHRVSAGKIMAFKAGPDVLDVPKAIGDALIKAEVAEAAPKSKPTTSAKE